jgi:hypothetical protein
MQINGSVGITYPDGTVQTTAFNPLTAVTSFDGGPTGLTPSTPLTGAVSLAGVLNPVSGGTGVSGPTGVPFFNGASPVTAATAAQIAAVVGTTPVTAANNLQNGLANQIPYQTAANTTTFMAAPTLPNTTLIWNGTAFTWRNQGDTYQGTWNASTNTPTITSGVGVNGQYYIVSVAGTTTIDGISDWQVGDQIIFNGSVWQQVTGSGVGAFPNLIVSGLTGYMYANAAGLVTSSTTIPNTAITGLGTMSTQNANAVAITGGTISGITGGSLNNTPIGATTASTGAFTTLSASTSANFTTSGTVVINPTTTTGSTMDGVVIGGTTAAAITGTTITATTYVGVSGGVF